MNKPTSTTATLDKQFVWHPFTQMREWIAPESELTVIASGRGALLHDETGREYLDGNASIWTNLHGHRNPVIDRALRRQLARIAHSSFLGLTNQVAPPLAERLVTLMAAPDRRYRVFFSDDGSTAMEAALKMAIQARLQRGESQRTRFVSLGGGYHGDTVGAMSLGHSALFHGAYRSLMFETTEVRAPHCYRCPFNGAAPQRGADHRQTRQCQWECLAELERALAQAPSNLTALVLEPLIQGAAGMWMHPAGYLKRAAELCRARGVWLMLDEVMTGFGRTGAMFACQKEGVLPDLMALGKGITGGYLPLAATLASGEVFDAFLGEYAEFKTFFHGHSYSGNQLACAAALANLDLFASRDLLNVIARKSAKLRQLTQLFWRHPHVGDVRQEGLVCAIELVEDWPTRKPFPLAQRTGFRVCMAAKRHGLLTRPIGDVLLLMPPYCATDRQLARMVQSLWLALNDVLPQPRPLASATFPG